jgi:RNA ligase (TIGR02306 family)
MSEEITERALATIRTIAEIRDIPNADLIQAFRVDGWWVVDRKGKYSIGENVVYFEIDSWIPNSLAPFLTKGDNEPRVYKGVKGERLKSIKLRGQISQGLIMSIAEANVVGNVGDNLTEKLGIIKWDSEEKNSSSIKGVKAAGSFPIHLFPKTDEPRIQNYFNNVKDSKDTWEITTKLDGTSCSVFRWEDKLRVCSRNLELKIYTSSKPVTIFEKIKNIFGFFKSKITVTDPENAYIKTALSLNFPDGFAVQGEIIGEGIQGNQEKITGTKFFCFNVFNITEQKKLSPTERREFCKTYGINHVPVIDEAKSIEGISLDDLISFADGPSLFAKLREGLVYKSNEHPEIHFKTISNKWLIKNDG